MEMPLIVYFAAHAPEVPAWFVLQDEKPLPPILTILQAMQADPRHGMLSGDDQRWLERHFENQIDELPGNLMEIWSSAVLARDENLAARDAARKQNEGQRFYTWRWSYAENMERAAQQFQPDREG